ncbi:centrosomal protein of 170 kDa protein B isoform X2 [Antennarius striatus]|uniref:centrosomal protein of 170 kDa protein B isoform X2 n=1 Tax=Antennarius striatus TaxID=241820 RepID=UPI0035B26F9F
MSVTSWFLVSSSGTRHRLPREMIFVGRDDCELMLQSRSVDKQHAVINYDTRTDEHMVKDLGSLNGHEKYTSQLQLSLKSLEAKMKEKKQLQSSEKSLGPISNVKQQDKGERRARSLTGATETPISKPTPLYGQPSWWGEDDDPTNKKQDRGGKSSPDPAKLMPRYEANGALSEKQAKSIFSYRRESSYFDIPTKESRQQPSKKPKSQVHEVPTKDTPVQLVTSTSTPPVVQSHASFTIEFDECSPGKMKIKDHVTKFSSRHRHNLHSTETVTTPTEVMSAENKVADWLFQSNASMMSRRPNAEDKYSTNNDSSLLKITKANQCEDDEQSDSGGPDVNGDDFDEPELQTWVSPTSLRASSPQRFTPPHPEEPISSSPPESRSQSSRSTIETQQAFVIEFFDNPRNKRSQSFTNNTSPPETPNVRVHLENARKTFRQNGESHIPSSASSTPPTQRYTIPLKDSDSTGSPRRDSLRRQETGNRSPSLSSRSSSSVSVRPFSSVGRRSKLTAEFLKQIKQCSAASWERNTRSPPPAAKTETVMTSQSSPPSSTAPYQPQTSSPIHQPVPLKAPVMPQASQSVEVKSPRAVPRNDEEDTLSDAGTYTIDTDIQDKELEEARSKIDQVFGVFESPEQPQQTEAETPSAFRPVICQTEGNRENSCGELKPDPEQGQSLVKAEPSAAVLQGAPKWMSRWASLADSYTETGPSSGLFDILPQMELTVGGEGMNLPKATLQQHHDEADLNVSRPRRVLPELPLGDKRDVSPPSIHVHYDLHSTFVVDKNPLVVPDSLDNHHSLSVQDDVEPDSLSEASKSDDGSIIGQRRTPPSDTEEKKKNYDSLTLQPKSTSFYIGSEMDATKPEQVVTKRATKIFSTATLTKSKNKQDSGKVRPNVSAPILGYETQNPEGRVSPLIRQESFTTEHPSTVRLPNISSQPVPKDSDFEPVQGSSSQDTHSYLKETEDVLAVLEAKLQAGQSQTSQIVDSLSGESDMDTSSTVSQQSGKNRPNALTRNPPVSGLHRKRFSANVANQNSAQLSSTTGKRSSEDAQSNNKTVPVRRLLGLRRGVGKRGSTDLSDDPQSLPYSDQESNNHPSQKYTVPLQKEDSKTSRASRALSRANSLSAPRPTRASMLRRARLGEASDNEGTETDRQPQEPGGVSAKQPQETKKLSRLDMLAMPRKRTSSFNTPSDSEAGRSTGFSSTESGGNSVRRSSVPVQKPGERPQKPPLNKAPITRIRSSSAKYASSTASSRRRQKGSDYTSTSDEEYDSNQSTPKNKRSQPSSASHSPRIRPKPVIALRPEPRSRESEEENHEGEVIPNWSNHSAEIARLSQDLAKDLAILAREIHDVAGDGDLQNAGAEGSAPLSMVTAHEQLVHRIPEAGLNYHRVPPSSSFAGNPNQNVADEEQELRQQSRDEDMVDNLMLNPLSQVITAIRENTEQLAVKIKVLFEDRMDIWQEIEANINSDNDVPAVKTSNKVITSILKELRRVQRQLEVINTVVEPSERSEVSKPSAPPLSSASGVQPSRPPPAQGFRTFHSASTRGGGLRRSGSMRRAAATPGDAREGYLV